MNQVDQQRKHRREREYVEGELVKGRSIDELHRVIDNAVSQLLQNAKTLPNKIRLVETERDQLIERARPAADHLRLLGEYGNADKVLKPLDEVLKEFP
jgi:hypothetical protein